MRIFTVRVKNRQQEKKVRAALKLVDAEFVENSEEFFYSENLKKELVNFMDYLLTKQFSETQVVPKKIPQFGCAKGKFRMSDDFDDYLELR